MLRKKAAEDKKWNDLHQLRNVFSDRPIPERFYKPRSISYTPLDNERDFQKIVSVIWEDDGKFLENVPSKNVEAFIWELDHLAGGAKHFANFHRDEAERLAKFEEFVRKLENTVRDQRSAPSQSYKKD